MLRFTTVMSGHPGAPYYSTFYTDGNTAGEATAGAAALRTFWDQIKGYITAGGNVTLVPECDQVDPATGFVTDTFPVTFAAVATTGNAPLPKATQGLIRLRTSAFNSGKRLQGRLFIPALANDAQVGGVPSGPFVASLDSAAETLATSLAAAGDWGIYSRKYRSFAALSSITVWTQFAVLRSRRD